VIRDGLTPGEQVVIDGQDKLQAGTPVSFKPATATPSSTGGSTGAAPAATAGTPTPNSTPTPARGKKQ